VGTWFQVLFHSPPGVLFTFPSRYSFAIGRQEYLALDGGPPSFPHERPSTWYSGGQIWRAINFAYGAVTLSGPPFLTGSTRDRFCNSSGSMQGPDTDSYNPDSETAATYHAESVWAIPVSLATTQGMISFPPATEMFQFADLPPSGLYIQPAVTGHYPSRVSPFGHLRIKACSQLPGAFRRLPRPSSAPGAKASTPCPV
jgi:hypothetical protein